MAKENANVKKAKQLTNPTQKKMLGDFMEIHPEFARGLLNDQQGRNKKTMLWKNLTNILNSNGPPTKTENEWKKVWQDQKWAVKRKLNHNKKELKKTGGGSYQIKELTAVEETISRSAGLEATVNGLNSKRFGANRIGESSHTIQLECTPLTFDTCDEIIDMLDISTGLDENQDIDKAECEIPTENDDRGTQDAPLNKFTLLKKSLSINQELLTSFKNIENFLENIQEQNKAILELKKQKLTVLKEANILKKQKLLELKRMEHQNSYL